MVVSVDEVIGCARDKSLESETGNLAGAVTQGVEPTPGRRAAQEQLEGFRPS